jgi:hypothetical protein
MKMFTPLLLTLVLFGFSLVLATEGYDDLAKLVKSGADEEVLLAFISNSPVTYRLTVDEVLQLKSLGTSSKVIAQTIQHQAPKQAAAPAAQSADSSKKQTVVIYQNEPEDGGHWVWVDDYWYWRRPSGILIDLGWWPVYGYNYGWYGPGYGWYGRGWGPGHGRGHGGHHRR